MSMNPFSFSGTSLLQRQLDCLFWLSFAAVAYSQCWWCESLFRLFSASNFRNTYDSLLPLPNTPKGMIPVADVILLFSGSFTSFSKFLFLAGFATVSWRHLLQLSFAARVWLQLMRWELAWPSFMPPALMMWWQKQWLSYFLTIASEAIIKSSHIMGQGWF